MKYKILIIDNNFLLPLLCKSKLEMENIFDVEIKISVKEAIFSARQNKPDAILLSTGVSDYCGLDVLKSLKNGLANNINVIVLWRGDCSSEREFFESGAFAVVDVLESSLDAFVRQVKKAVQKNL